MNTEPSWYCVRLCELCVEGKGGECHTPGCALWCKSAPDVPLGNVFCVPGVQPAELELLHKLEEQVRASVEITGYVLSGTETDRLLSELDAARGEEEPTR